MHACARWEPMASTKKTFLNFLAIFYGTYHPK
jgi:hypothetical protein